MADFETPELKEYTIIPKYKDGTMEGLAPFIAKEAHNKPLGYLGELVDNWKEKVIEKMGDLQSR